MSFVPALALIFLLCVIRFIALRRRSPVEEISGPHPRSWIYGSLLDLLFPPAYGDLEFGWQKQYGPVYRIKGFCGADHLIVSDPLALQHILTSSLFSRSPGMQNLIQLIDSDKSVVALPVSGMSYLLLLTLNHLSQSQGNDIEGLVLP
ncbi:hypothetical protein C8J57DRAFT_1521493 [Mycena rebaudengoi]|nr:hypothetical protein C8J57DRAFT_1521493 [Mycena rebaudengoi]